ncbi:DEAD/DEAH box helicase [Alicyclobacillus tolerans]|uniref:DEAD/DEAH box helicase n=1 Tax=Alicyclobacillus tolerans TaxID=90970 RepID=UPI001F2DF217|nr:DEAD/DEAH box helicase [Alicyclobacillus tolerans]MCF8565857.1 DEAD/DEAH box helicase [Alicyclobacillus tolerans]
MALFTEMEISDDILKSLEQMGFETATAIQTLAIPVALSGRDLIGQAQTGTGKTVAFAIPMVQKVVPTADPIQGLILTPTRELCIQVAEEVLKVGSEKGVRVLAIYGGQDIERQIRALRNRPQVIVATPGRLLDHMNRRTIRLNAVHTVVLDEADEMLDMGFIEDIEAILGACPEDRQTLLFSATMKPGVQNLAKKFMKDFEMVAVKTQEMTVPTIEQVYYEVNEGQKLDVLTRLLDIQNPELAIVFGRTKRRVDELTRALQTRGYLADGLHGDLSQRQRDNVMAKFREGALEVLVATDVAARGLDVSGVTHVFNFDIPQDMDSYVHRIGRTGRAGKTGIASTFVSPREMEHLRAIERFAKRKINRQPLPSFTEARVGKQKIAMEQLLDESRGSDLSGIRMLAEELLQQQDSVSLVSAAIKLLTKNTKEVPIKLTAEQPLRIRRTSQSSGPGRSDRGPGGRSDRRTDRRSGPSAYARGARTERRGRHGSGSDAPYRSRPH